jgi:hypothetical protein
MRLQGLAEVVQGSHTKDAAVAHEATLAVDDARMILFPVLGSLLP